MERIIYRKTLDVHKSGVQFTLQGFQTADNMSRTVELSLMASGDTIDLPLEQLVAVMYVTTPNATEPSINECTIKDNTVVCDILPIVEEGITEVQLKLIETGVDGASRVLPTPKFAIEVSKSNMKEEGATQNATFSALETALAKAKGVYDSRVTRIVLSPDCIFSVYYADGTVYTNDALRDVLVNGESLIAKSYARGGTGVRDGEETDNSMYYSNVSKSSSIEANTAMEQSLELLEEVRKHGVYTAFSFNFEKGELEYVSPMYKFDIDEETGELVAIGETYSFDEVVNSLVAEATQELTTTISETEQELKNSQRVFIADSPDINPADSLGGEWELFDKEFEPNNWSDYQYNDGEYALSYKAFLSGHLLKLYVTLTPSSSISDDASFDGIFRWETLGFNEEELDVGGLNSSVAHVYIGSSVLLAPVRVTGDGGCTIKNIGSEYIPAGAEYHFDVIIPATSHEQMLDHYCNKFYWKRIDNDD